MTEVQFEIALKNMRRQTALIQQKTILKDLERSYNDLKQARKDLYRRNETLLETQKLHEQMRLNIASLLSNK